MFFPEAGLYFVTITYFLQLPFIGHARSASGVYEDTSFMLIRIREQMEGFVALSRIQIANALAHVEVIGAFCWS